MNKKTLPPVTVEPKYRPGMLLATKDDLYGRVTRVEATVTWDDKGNSFSLISYKMSTGTNRSPLAHSWSEPETNVDRVIEGAT